MNTNKFINWWKQYFLYAVLENNFFFRNVLSVKTPRYKKQNFKDNYVLHQPNSCLREVEAIKIFLSLKVKCLKVSS